MTERVGWALFVLGLLASLGAQMMDTTVQNAGGYTPGLGYVEPTSTHNIGLLSEKLTTVISSATLWVVGALLVIAGRVGAAVRVLTSRLP